MSLTLLQILDAVSIESGLGTNAAYAAATNDEVKRLFYLANRSANDLSEYAYQALRKSYPLTLTAATEYALPSDYRGFIPDTGYADSRFHRINFPTSAEYRNLLTSTSSASGVDYDVWLLGDQIVVHQPNSGDIITWEYYSNTPVLDTDGTTQKQRFTADTDTWRLDDDLLIKDVLWRHKKLIGLQDWQADLADFKSYERKVQGREAAAQTLSEGEGSIGFAKPYYNLWRT